jgi:hypothetical protein
MKNDIQNKDRRAFMRGISLVMAGSTAYALTPNFAWAAGDDTLEDLARVCYVLYPHKKLPYDFYRACAQGLIDKSAGDAALKKTLDDGMERLNRVYSPKFRDASESEQRLAMQRVYGTPFFDAVRGHTVVGLYNIPEVWRHFGYQGPSFPQGGYINRGFDDINWL